MAKGDECFFCKVIAGEQGCRKLYEDEAVLSILDREQMTSDGGEFIPGRCLVLPKKHVSQLYDLEDEECGKLFVIAKLMAAKINQVFNPDFVTMFFPCQHTSHIHIVLQPSVENDPVDKVFKDMRLITYFKLAPEELLDDMARRIRET